MPVAAATASRRRVTLVQAVLAAAALLLLLVPAASAEAEGRAAKRVALPALPAGQSVETAQALLRRSGFRPAVLRADGYPAARPGHGFVAVGWAVERRTTAARRTGGRRTARVRYLTVKAGSRHPAGTRIHVRPRQVRLPAAPSAAGPAPSSAAASASPAAAAAAEPAPPAVDAGGTPVVAEPPPAATAGGADVAPPATTAPPTTAPTEPAAPTTPGTPAPGPVPPPVDLEAETARYLRDSTVHLPFMDGCTGFLLQDASGTPIGAVSAAHCGLLPERTPRVTGRDGRLYAVVPGPLAVRRGEALDAMRTVATAESVTVAPAADRTHDLALISFAGVSPSQVRAAYEAIRLGPAEIASLAPGRTVTLSAFPKVQPGVTGATRRQVMTATVLGRAPVYTASLRTIPTVWTAMRANADGAVCSFGASGGAAVTAALTRGPDGTLTPEFRVLGVLAGFDDFRPAGLNTAGYDGPRVRLEREAQTGFDLAGVDTTCDYAHELPAASTAETVRLVTSSAQIPR